MNKAKTLISYIPMLFGLLAMVYGFAVIVEKDAGWQLNFFIFSVTVVVSTVILLLIMRVQRERQKAQIGVFVSYPEGEGDAVEMLKRKLTNRLVIEGELAVKPGENIEHEVKRYVGKSSICFVLIGDKVSQQQKIEIKEIIRQKKKVIPIRLSPDVKMPTSLKNTKSILLSDFCSEAEK